MTLGQRHFSAETVNMRVIKLWGTSMRTAMAKFAVFALALIAQGSVYAITNELGWTLDSALKQIARQADDFDTVLADVEIRWTDDDGFITRERTGRAYMNNKGEIRFAEFESGEHVILVRKNEVQDYDATRALVERYSLSKHKDRLEPYARLGFTTTGKDLKDDYLVTLLGEDKIADRRVVGLELTPKKERTREVVANLRLWIDQASWMPVRQEIVHVKSGETLTITYTGMARNLKLNPNLFKDRWPKGTQKIKR
jgi:outer membrane lipoprotein-sorting protein